MRTSSIVKPFVAAALVLAAAAPAVARAQSPEDVIVFVVGRSNPAADLSADELKAILLGKRRTWGDGARVIAIDLENGPARDAVNARVLHMSRSDVERYWVEQRVRGAGSAPKVAGSAASVVKLVAKVRGAIGYVPLSEVDGTVKVLKIGGVAPGAAGYPVVAR